MFGLSKLLLLALTAAGQVIFLSGMIVVDNLPHRLGETVRLKVEPVDPRDLFRGDYVILGYDFSRTETSAIKNQPADWNDSSERVVYIRLKKAADGDYSLTDEVTALMPKEGSFIRGKASGRGPFRIRAGIEAYYVQEGRGREIEEAIRNRRPVYAEAAVWNGTAKLKRVIVE